MNSGLFDEPIQDICKSALNSCCLWVNRTGLVKADKCFGNKKHYFCERSEYAKQKRFKDDKYHYNNHFLTPLITPYFKVLVFQFALKLQRLFCLLFSWASVLLSLEPGAQPAHRTVGPGLQIFGLITLPLVIDHPLLGWAKNEEVKVLVRSH